MPERPSIILEGPDGAGKTHAADKLMAYDCYQYQHEGVPPANAEMALLSYYQLRWEQVSKPVVFDRFIIGELVYGPVMRSGAKFTVDEAYKFINKNFVKSGALHVLCLPPLSVCLLHWNKRNFEGKEYVREFDLFRRIYEGYHDLAHWRRGLLWDLIVCEPYSNWPVELMEGDLLHEIQEGGDTLWITKEGSRQTTSAG